MAKIEIEYSRTILARAEYPGSGRELIKTRAKTNEFRKQKFGF